jgi:hypothetical protein
LEAQHYLDEYVRSNHWDDSGIELKSHLQPVRHTAQERALYLNHANLEKPDPSTLLQLCSFFSPDGGEADADAAVISTRLQNKAALEKHRQEMAKASEEARKLEADEAAGFPGAKDGDERRRFADKLRRLRAGQPEREAKERQLVGQANYFEEMLKELQKLDQEAVECPMCMDSLKPDGCMVTSCGHLFCSECIRTCLQNNGQCPTCRRALQEKTLMPATDVLACAQGDSDSRFQVGKFGSKLQAVCEQLERIWAAEPDAKVIIFVQFEVLLRKTEGALKDLNLPCQTLQGSLFERRKTIRQFQTPGPHHRVLLVSLEKSPSGMNLVCCHHLILVHPMYAESQEAALGYERQAIGRVRRRGQRETVHVYRFFTQSTLEERLTLEHHKELYDDAVGGASSSHSPARIAGASSASASG